MATVNQIKIIVEAEDKASAPIEQATKSTRNLGRASREVTRESKKDWAGLADLFGGVLPRNLQMLQRGFKGTQRQVGRLSKSFKILKSAWASIGIGLIIMAVEELVSNWDEWSDRLGITNEKEREAAALNKTIVAQQAELSSQTKGYVEQLTNLNLKDEERKVALDELEKSLGNYIDREATAEEQAAQANALLDANSKLLDTNTTLKDKQTKQAEASIATGKDEVSWGLKVIGTFRGLALQYTSTAEAQEQADKKLESANEDLTTSTEAQIEAQASLNALLETATIREEKLAEAEREREKTAREAEAAKKKSIADAEADAKWLANQRIQLAQETELRLIEDEEKRDLRSLEMQHEAAKAELEERSGTLTDKLELEQAYLMDKAEIENDYREQALDADRAVNEKQTALSDELFALGETERDREESQAQQLYDRRVALAGDDEGLIKQATQALVDDLDKIQERADEKEIADAQKVQDIKLQGMNKAANAISGVLGGLGDLAEEGSEQQKRLAITDVILNQAVAMANAVAGAAKASKDTGPAAPFLFAAYVATMLGTVVSTFASIKGIMSEANANVGGGGGGGGRGGFAPVSPQVPLPARLDTPDMQAYVVQSQLQGQQNAQGRLHGQIVL